MATMETGLRNVSLQAVINQFIATGTAFSYFQVEAAASGTAIAKLTFATAAFASADAGTAIAGTITAGVSSGGGTIDHVCFYNAVNAKQLTSTIATSTAQDFQISGLDIGAGDSVACTSLVLTQPAS